MILLIFIFSFGLGAFGEVFAVSDYSSSQMVWIRPGYRQQHGIKLLYNGLILETEIAGRRCVSTDENRANNFINFDIDDSFVFDGTFNEVILTVEYLDIGNDTLAIQYDSTNPWPFSGAFMRAGRIIKKQNTRAWKTYTTRLRNIRFANRQGYGPAPSALLNSGGGDVRINNRGDGDEYISYITIRIPYITVAVNELGNIFDYEDNISILINLNNRTDESLSTKLEYKVLDFDNKTIQSKIEKIDIPKMTTLPYALQINTAKFGTFFIYLKLYKDNDVVEEYITSFAVCPKPVQKHSSQSPFGVAVLLQHGDVDQIIRIMTRLGISWARHDFRSDVIAQQKFKISWEMRDTIVKKCYENGINICDILLDGEGADPASGSEKEIEDFKNFVYKVVYRYKDKIKYWEIWNEPDLRCFWPGGPNAENYTKLLKASYTAIKKIDSTSKVLIGGLGGGARNRFWFLDHIYKNKGGDSFDIVAIHPYTAPDPPEKNNALEQKINDVSIRLYKKGDVNKKIWITEIGWPTAKDGQKMDIDFRDQANFLVRSYIIALSNPNTGKIFWHCFRNYGLDPEAPQQNFGLINNDFTPKPAAVAYLNMVNHIEGLQYIGKLDLKNPLRGYVFGDGDKKVKVLWSAKEDRRLNLPIKSKSVVVTDIMGNTGTMESKRGIIKLSLTQSPIFLKEE